MNWDWLGGIFRPGPTFRYRMLLLVVAVYLLVDALHKYVASWRANYLAWRLEPTIAALLIFAAWWLQQTEKND